jgi:hypothetical protein
LKNGTFTVDDRINLSEPAGAPQVIEVFAAPGYQSAA